MKPLFDSKSLPEPQRTWWNETVGAHTFDFDRCSRFLPDVSRYYGIRREIIRPKIRSCAQWSAYACTFIDGVMWFDPSIADNDPSVNVEEPTFRGVVMHELGHAFINWFVMPKHLQKPIVEIYKEVYPAARWNDMRDAEGNIQRPGIGHPLCAGFTKAFSPFDADDDNFHPVDPIPELLRDLIG